MGESFCEFRVSVLIHESISTKSTQNQSWTTQHLKNFLPPKFVFKQFTQVFSCETNLLCSIIAHSVFSPISVCESYESETHMVTHTDIL